MSKIVCTLLALFLVFGHPASLGAATEDLVPALTTPEFDELVKLMAIDESVEVMRQEGLAYGTSLDADLLGGKGGEAWARLVSGAYDPEKMLPVFLARLRQEMQSVPQASLKAFFTSELGRRVVRLELSARQALLDKSLEDLADQIRDEMILSKDPRLELIQHFIEVSDLVDLNVMGAMNANFAFYNAMSQAGAFGDKQSEQDILSDVWSQESETRAQTEGWLVSFLALAYQPLSEEDMLAYIAFSQTAPAQSLNRAMFAAFDAMFVDISRDLGREAAKIVKQQDL